MESPLQMLAKPTVPTNEFIGNDGVTNRPTNSLIYGAVLI
jgi:hypothetical protein